MIHAFLDRWVCVHTSSFKSYIAVVTSSRVQQNTLWAQKFIQLLAVRKGMFPWHRVHRGRYSYIQQNITKSCRIQIWTKYNNLSEWWEFILNSYLQSLDRYHGWVRSCNLQIVDTIKINVFWVFAVIWYTFFAVSEEPTGNGSSWISWSDGEDSHVLSPETKGNLMFLC